MTSNFDLSAQNRVSWARGTISSEFGVSVSILSEFTDINQRRRDKETASFCDMAHYGDVCIIT